MTELRDKKSQLLFLFFYSVAETGFHTLQLIPQILCKTKNICLALNHVYHAEIMRFKPYQFKLLFFLLSTIFDFFTHNIT